MLRMGRVSHRTEGSLPSCGCYMVWPSEVWVWWNWGWVPDISRAVVKSEATSLEKSCRGQNLGRSAVLLTDASLKISRFYIEYLMYFTRKPITWWLLISQILIDCRSFKKWSLDGRSRSKDSGSWGYMHICFWLLPSHCFLGDHSDKSTHLS